ncbi:hypothetical protein CKO38_07375 [Rhodospirillum rubrum]|uniref:hypothetical protein n=1 Tax=Rhodospirillum rubrum TaxID=1085 RepID=UPI00190704F0|nr:hypothetical protein [Rhodospirillum rubrum]MBK1676493.1 hypothetical protein [Rhodospirillum rubrum]
MIEILTVTVVIAIVTVIPLVVLWMVSGWSERAFAPAAAPPPTAAPKARPEAAIAAPNSAVAGIPATHLAVIGAAVAALMDRPYRISRVIAPAHKIADWPQEGRIETFSAHRIRTNWGPTRPTLGGQTPDILRGRT